MGGTTGGDVSFAWGLLMLILIEVFAFGDVTWATVVSTGACSAEGELVGTVPAGCPGLTSTGLMVTGDGDLATDETGDDIEVTVVDLLGAGLMGGTFMDDIITIGGGGLVAGTVLTTTEALVFAGSTKDNRKMDLRNLYIIKIHYNTLIK